MKNTRTVEHHYMNGGYSKAASVYEPTICPHCHAYIHAKEIHFTLTTRANGTSTDFVSLLQCPACGMPFLVFYKNRNVDPSFIAPLKPNTYTPPHHVAAVSPDYVRIYQEALEAETYGLYEICGMGYRKALEFLIKDFLIHNHPDEASEIKKTSLGKCISCKITHPQLKTLAERATWLGNDQTHYIKKFEEYELEDLKRFLNAAVQWIDSELTFTEALSITPR